MGTFIEYMCKTCGMKVSRGQNSGRPNPGRCPKSSNKGPHKWIINRRI